MLASAGALLANVALSRGNDAEKQSDRKSWMVLVVIAALCGLVESIGRRFHGELTPRTDVFLASVALLGVGVIVFWSHGTEAQKRWLEGIPRESTETLKGFAQAVLLLYHATSCREAYGVARIFTGLFFFLTGFGQWSSWRMRGGSLFSRLMGLVYRILIPTLVLCAATGNSLILYYVVPITLLFSIEAWIAGVVSDRFGGPLVGLGMWAMLHAIGGVGGMKMLGELVFGKSFIAHELGFRFSLDAFAPVWGAMSAEVLRNVSAPRVGSTRRWVVWSVAMIVVLIGFWLVGGGVSRVQVVQWVQPLVGPFVSIALVVVFAWTPFGTGSSTPFMWLGKHTLELYLLQHHVWLARNAKARLALFPPSLTAFNWVFTSLLFLALSWLLQSASTSITRYSRSQPTTNSSSLFLTFLPPFLAAYILPQTASPLTHILLGVTFTATLLTTRPSSHPRPTILHMCRPIVAFVTGCIVCTATLFPPLPPSPPCQYVFGAFTPQSPTPTPHAPYLLSHPRRAVVGGSGDVWEWEEGIRDAGGRPLRGDELQRYLKSNDITFIGDSIARNLFRASLAHLPPTYILQNTSTFSPPSTAPLRGHCDWIAQPSPTTPPTTKFLWSPFISNLSSLTTRPIDLCEVEQTKKGRISTLGGGGGVVVVSVGWWDVLHQWKGISTWEKELEASLRQLLSSLSPPPTLVLLTPSAVQPWRLPSIEKRNTMTQERGEELVQAVRRVGDRVRGRVVGMDSITRTRTFATNDGVHYSDAEYDIGLQGVALAATNCQIASQKQGYVPRDTTLPGNFYIAIFHVVAIIVTRLFTKAIKAHERKTE